jgi:transposase
MTPSVTHCVPWPSGAIFLDTEAKKLSTMMEDLVMRNTPHLVEPFGFGVNSAAEILMRVIDNPESIKSEAAFAKLAGVSPISAGSGITSGTYRTSHGGHRQLNVVIFRTMIVFMRFHEPTIAYVTPRTAEGKFKRDIIRCLKRYVIQETYDLIKAKPITLEIATSQLIAVSTP